MATTKPTRRRFLATVAAAAAASAATALPSSSDALPRAPTWPALRASHPALRDAYLTEIQRLAATLRPRFEAGELYGLRDAGAEGMDALEDAARAHFGLGVTTEERGGWTWYVGDEPAAHLVLALSPSAAAVDEGGWTHVAHHAALAASWDVLNTARARGWYMPTPDEEPHPGHVDGDCPWCSSEGRS